MRELLDLVRDYHRPMASAAAFAAALAGFFMPSVPADKLAIMLSVTGLYTVARTFDKRVPPKPKDDEGIVP